MIERLEVLRRGDDEHPLGAAFLGAPHVHQPHAVGLGGEFFEIRLGLRVGGQMVIIANRETEMLRDAFLKTLGGEGSPEKAP